MTACTDFTGRRVLVTGGTGFIGGRVVERLVLEHGAKVTVLVRDFAKAMRVARFGEVTLMAGNTVEEKAVEEAARHCKYIIHCAHDMAGTFPRHNLRVNAIGTANVVRAARATGARMVHVSSADVYGRPGGAAFDESAPYAGRGNFYCEAKRRTESVVIEQYRKDPFPVCVLQPTVVYGPHAGWTLGTCQRLLTGSVILPASGEGCCNAVYIDDLVDAVFFALTKSEAAGHRFLISGADHVSWHDWYARHAAALGLSPPPRVSPEEYTRIERIERRGRSLGTALRALAAGVGIDMLRGLLRAGVVEKAVKGVVHAVGDALFTLPGCDRWDANARSLLRRLRARARLRADTGPRHVLPEDAWEASLYSSRSQASIGKARDLLGYAPRHTFERGMEVTERFIRWAIPETDHS